MKLEKLKNKIEKATIAVATCDKEGNPHNIVIMYAKVEENKIIITNNYMQKTKGNLKENSRIALVFWEGENGWKINGEAKYYNSGKWLEFVKSLKENKGHPARGAIVINVKEIKKC